jgi:Tol biopolymer transport system component
MNADGGDARALTTSEGPERQPAWSPGGEFLAFAAMRTGASAIWTMRADGSGQTQVTDGFIHRLAPSWGPG